MWAMVATPCKTDCRVQRWPDNASLVKREGEGSAASCGSCRGRRQRAIRVGRDGEPGGDEEHSG